MKAAATKQAKGHTRKVSEILFEDYLRAQRLHFEYENHRGKQRQPDYHIEINDSHVVCEVTELLVKDPLPNGASGFDPYGRIRKKIHKERTHFEEYKDSPCVLVLYNVDDWEFRDWPYVLFGAMLGDPTMQWSVDLEKGCLLPGSERNVFSGRGMMTVSKQGRRKNTTFSAIAVLSEYTIHNPAFETEFKMRAAQLGNNLTQDERIVERLKIRMGIYDEMPLTLGTCPRLVVFDNPLARKPLPLDIFQGDFDERHRINDKTGRIERIYAGSRLMDAEKLKSDKDDVSQHLQRFTQDIVRDFDCERIVLFGSHAHGSADSGSDVDLLVIVPGGGDASHLSLEIRKRLGFSFPLDLITYSTQEAQRRLELGDSFLREIIENGVILYQRGAKARPHR